MLSAVIGVAGLAFEARIASGKHTCAVCGDGSAIMKSLAGAIAGDCRGLISFGIAGGLSPDLRAGTCVVASSIVCETGWFITDRTWSRNALRLIPHAVHGTIAGVSDGIVGHPAAKGALHARTRALAVDNESHLVASVAAAHGLPMTAVRVVMDPATRVLPRSAVVALRPDGSIDFAALARLIARKPGDLPTLLRTAIDASIGFVGLLRCRRLLGSGLGLPSLPPSEASLRPGAEVPAATIGTFQDEYRECP